MNICIRVDASSQIGTGHVMRCLTLAEELRENGANISFICRVLPGDLISYVKQQGYGVYPIMQDTSVTPIDMESDAGSTRAIIEQLNLPIEWLVIDHYQISAQWELRLRTCVKKVAVIDDLADRDHICDLLLDQNFYGNMEHRYDQLVPPYCVQLLGPSYALLRKEFIVARSLLQSRTAKIQRLFVFFGGSDPTAETEKVLLALQKLQLDDLIVDVVVGSSNQRKQTIERLCSSIPNVNYYCQISHMSSLMSLADLAIGAGGTATWERMYLGLPTITIIVADNQEETIQALSKSGLILNLGRSEKVSETMIAARIQEIADKPNIIKEMADQALFFMNKGYQEGVSYMSKLILEESMHVQ